MPYPPDFKDSHRRHWQDAELLFCNNRSANADQLYGFSVECGLKALMHKMSNKPVPKLHADKLWQHFKTFAKGRSGRWYHFKLPQGEPFRNWLVDDRYAHRQSINKSDVETHRSAARGVFRMIKGAEQDGML